MAPPPRQRLLPLPQPHRRSPRASRGPHFRHRLQGLGCPPRRSAPPSYHAFLNVKSAAIASPSFSVIFRGWLPSVSCQASISYSPGGSLPSLKVPSSPVTAKNGCVNTPTWRRIQLWMSHLKYTLPSSGRVNDISFRWLLANTKFAPRFRLATRCTLFAVSSLPVTT